MTQPVHFGGPSPIAIAEQAGSFPGMLRRAAERTAPGERMDWRWEPHAKKDGWAVAVLERDGTPIAVGVGPTGADALAACVAELEEKRPAPIAAAVLEVQPRGTVVIRATLAATLGAVLLAALACGPSQGAPVTSAQTSCLARRIAQQAACVDRYETEAEMEACRADVRARFACSDGGAELDAGKDGAP
jgi:hypothetical protein